MMMMIVLQPWYAACTMEEMLEFMAKPRGVQDGR
jgi:hypothetical protein